MHKKIKKTYSLFIVLYLTTMNYVNADQSIHKPPTVSEALLAWQQGTIQHFTFEAGLKVNIRSWFPFSQE